MEKKTKKLLEDILYFWVKLCKKEKLNYYDERILKMLEEYNYITEYKKEWSKRECEHINN